MMTRDEITAHYALLAAEYGGDVLFYLNTKNLRNKSDEFLLEMMPRFDQRNDESRGLLLSMFKGFSEDDIRWILRVHAAIEGTTYLDIRIFLESFNLYIGKGLMKKPKRVKADLQALTALYNITIALVDIQTDYYRGDARQPLIRSDSSGGSTYYINHKGFLAFIIDNAERHEEIEEVIRQHGYVHLPSIIHVLDGGTKGISGGAL